MSRFITICFALALSTPAVAGTWSQDVADFADLTAEDFQTQPDNYWSVYDQANPLLVGDVGYWGYVWSTTGWCIPGMDSNSPCGGTNVYLASAVDLHIVPQVPSSRLGFDYGTQGSQWHAIVTLDDGSVDQIDLQGTEPGPWGGFLPITGFLGYTADDGRTIVEIYCSAGDGGVDNVRMGAVGGGTCDDLSAAVLDLELPPGIENSFLAKVDAATAAAERGSFGAAANQLGALLNAISAQTGQTLTVDEAEALSTCVQAAIDAL